MNEREIHIYPISEKFYLVLHGTAKWTKEMFDAELIVVNNSLYETMEDCSASLDALPEGLSLAEMTGGEQSLEAELGTIAPGGTKSIHWYLRGDEPGSYQISGRVSAEMSEGDVLEAEFQTHEPIEVLAGNAMHLYITVEDKTWENDIYNVIFELKNVSDWPVYNLSLKLDQEQQYRVTKKNGTETTKEYLDEELEHYVETESLLPGESLVLEFSTIIKFQSEQVADPEYVLVGMWLEMLEGSTTSIPYTFRLVSGVREISRWLSLLEFFSLKECLSQDPVNVLTGDFLWSYTDLFLSGRHDLSYTRYYTSTQTSYGRLGKGWSDNYDYHLYDRGEVVIISLPAGGQTHFLKDGTDYTPIEGSAWQLETEGVGYLLTMHDQSRYHFDEDGNMAQAEIPVGNMLDFSYNEAGQLATASNASGALEFYYRGDGRIETIEDSAGRQVQFSYTDTGRLEQSENPDGDSLIYDYDDYGRLCGITDFNSNRYLTNEYDTSNRVTRQYVEGMGEFTYSYNEATRTNHYTRSDGSKVTIIYDDQNRIISETDTDGTRTYTYNSSSQRTKENDRNGNTTTYTYDEAGNVARIGYGDGSQERFAYNDQNLITEWIDAEGITTFYTYDSLGNLIKETQTAAGIKTETAYAYNNLNQLIQKGTTAYEYDRWGNLIQERENGAVTASYTYDSTNRMASGTKGRETSRYTYDGLGRLVRNGNAAGETTYVTDQTMGIDLPLSSMKGGKTANHVYGAEGTAVIGYEGIMYTVTSDRLGSIRRITSPEGTEIAGFTYDVWGRPEKTVAEGYETSALGVANYTGHLYDEALELYYAKARIYSPTIGRFLSEDPIRDGLN